MSTSEPLQILWHVRLVRSLASGLAAGGMTILLFELLAFYLRLTSPATATIISGECGVFINFLLNHHISFSDRATKGMLLRRLLRFHSVAAGSLFVQWLLVFFAQRYMPGILAINAAYAAAIALGFAWNYMGYCLWVWQRASRE